MAIYAPGGIKVEIVGAWNGPCIAIVSVRVIGTETVRSLSIDQLTADGGMSEVNAAVLKILADQAD